MGFFEKSAELLRSFYMGKIYPVTVVLLMFLSYTTATEVYINVVNVALLSIGLLVCDSIRPFIAVLPSYLYQFSVKTAMPTPEGLEYLLSGERLVLYIISFSILAVCLVVFFFKNGLLSGENLKKLPMPFAAILLSAAFLTNGLFSDRYDFSSTVYGIVQIITFFGIFYIFYLGIKNEDWEELVGYMAYVSALIAILIFADTVFLYANYHDTFIIRGRFERGLMLYGWGNCNTAGQCAAVMIPMCFLGVMRRNCTPFYFTAACLALASAFLSTSRNGMLVGSVAFVVCFVLSCFFGENRKSFAIFASAILGALAIFFFVFKDTTFLVLEQYFDRGFSDTGRFKLWSYAWEAFCESPVFGKGFFGLWTDTYHLEWGFPTMLHSTPLQILASMGAFGFAAYLIYRIFTLIPFFKRPNIEKVCLGISILIVLVGSLIDNFIFYIPHMLFYPIALAAAFKIYEDQDESFHDYYNYITKW